MWLHLITDVENKNPNSVDFLHCHAQQLKILIKEYLPSFGPALGSS